MKRNQERLWPWQSKPLTITEASHHVRRVIDTPPSEDLRFEVLALAKAVMVLHDGQRDDLLRETLRSWIGKIQRHVGWQS